jgi:hypothetical protein
MIAYVITEEQFDEDLLRRVLPQELLEEVVFVPDFARSNIVGMARTLIVERRKPLAIVMDAGSFVPEVIQERRQSREEVVGIVAGGVPFKVILAVPALEAVFFQDPCLLERAFAQPIPADVLPLARFDPSGSLDQLFARSTTIKNRTELLQVLTETEIAILRNAPVVQELIEFLQTARGWVLSGVAVSKG